MALAELIDPLGKTADLRGQISSSIIKIKSYFLLLSIYKTDAANNVTEATKTETNKISERPKPPFVVLKKEESTQALTCTLNNFPKDAPFMLSWRFNTTITLSVKKFRNTDSGTEFKYLSTKSGTYTCEVANGERVIDQKNVTVHLADNSGSSKFKTSFVFSFSSYTLSQTRWI